MTPSGPTPLTELVERRREWGAASRAVVFTNGCFDLLHPGHLELLEQARRAGDVLVVGINSDASVARLKGEGRPVIPQRERAETLLALEAVDRVTVYDEQTPLELIEALRPDVLVKGTDWASTRSSEGMSSRPRAAACCASSCLRGARRRG